MCLAAVIIYCSCCHRDRENYHIDVACAAPNPPHCFEKDLGIISYHGFCPTCRQKQDAGISVQPYRTPKLETLEPGYVAPRLGPEDLTGFEPLAQGLDLFGQDRGWTDDESDGENDDGPSGVPGTPRRNGSTPGSGRASTPRRSRVALEVPGSPVKASRQGDPAGFNAVPPTPAPTARTPEPFRSVPATPASAISVPATSWTGPRPRTPRHQRIARPKQPGPPKIWRITPSSDNTIVLQSPTPKRRSPMKQPKQPSPPRRVSTPKRAASTNENWLDYNPFGPNPVETPVSAPAAGTPRSQRTADRQVPSAPKASRTIDVLPSSSESSAKKVATGKYQLERVLFNSKPAHKPALAPTPVAAAETCTSLPQQPSAPKPIRTSREMYTSTANESGKQVSSTPPSGFRGSIARAPASAPSRLQSLEERRQVQAAASTPSSQPKKRVSRFRSLEERREERRQGGTNASSTYLPLRSSRPSGSPSPISWADDAPADTLNCIPVPQPPASAPVAPASASKKTPEGVIDIKRYNRELRARQHRFQKTPDNQYIHVVPPKPRYSKWEQSRYYDLSSSGSGKSFNGRVEAAIAESGPEYDPGDEADLEFDNDSDKENRDPNKKTAMTMPNGKGEKGGKGGEKKKVSFSPPSSWTTVTYELHHNRPMHPTPPPNGARCRTASRSAEARRRCIAKSLKITSPISIDRNSVSDRTPLKELARAQAMSSPGSGSPRKKGVKLYKTEKTVEQELTRAVGNLAI